MAWQSDSPLWATLHQVPSCEEVTVPQNIEPTASSTQAILRSPIVHPRVEIISGEMTLRRSNPNSPAVSAHDRFSSPVHPGRACRNLFSGGTTAMTAVPKTSLLNTPQSSSTSSNQATSGRQGKTGTIRPGLHACAEPKPIFPLNKNFLGQEIL